MESCILQFEDMTIRQLKKMTEDYNVMQEDIKILRIKYPNKSQKPDKKKESNSDNILKEVGVKCL